MAKNITCTVCKESIQVSSVITIDRCTACGSKEIKIEYTKKAKRGKYNATRTVNSEGVAFDSKLERYMYEMLVKFKIPFEFQVPFVLIEKFKYQGVTVRGTKLVLDFTVFDDLADTKGEQTEDNKIKMKMLKLKLIAEGREPNIVLLHDKGEVNKYVFSTLEKMKAKK